MSYSITSSARASSAGGTLRPSSLAVLRLITGARLSVRGCCFLPTLNRSAKRTSLRNSLVTVGQGMGAVENKERTEVKVPDREPNGPLSVLSWRYSLHADANCFPGVRICGLP